jgi:hypothetical protein
MKNSNNTIGNGTRDFTACSAVPQLTATACPHYIQYKIDLYDIRNLQIYNIKYKKLYWEDTLRLFLIAPFLRVICDGEYVTST